MPTEATREEMRDARLPLAYRDSCAHLLIPLNQCRKETWYAPWKCEVCSITAIAASVAGYSEECWLPMASGILYVGANVAILCF